MLKRKLFLLLIINSSLLFSQQWSFSFVADPRSGYADFKNALTEIKNLSVNPAPQIQRSEFVMITGDFDPAEKNWGIFNEVFPSSDEQSPKFLPVIGNHDLDYKNFIKEKILDANKKLQYNESTLFSYYLDWKNCRFIVVDQYSGTGFNNGCINETGIKWVEEKINSAGAEHIFIAFHEPAFPRYRHIGNSFDACPKERDEFWNMILQHKDKVRAVLVGHTHFYSKLKIKNVKGEAANPEKFPIEEGGIYQIDGGAAGNEDDGKNTIVEFLIDKSVVTARVIQADKDKVNFKVAETFNLN